MPSPIQDEGTAEIVRIFVAENREIFDRLDLELPLLLCPGADRELAASVFRGFHTIKGSSGFLGFARTQILAHAGERALLPLRDDGGSLSSALAAALRRAIRTLRLLTEDVATHGVEAPGDDTAVLQDLSVAASSRGAS